MSSGFARLVAALTSVALAAGGFAVVQLLTIETAHADSSPPSRSGLPATVTADVLPTMQVNGIVWAQATVASTVYAGGKFTYARPAGQAPSATHSGETPVGNLVAYNIGTGEMIASFTPKLNGQVRAIAASPDGSRVYVGGDFTTVDGEAHHHLVAFRTDTGQLDSTFEAAVGSTVTSIAVGDSVVYVGGAFTSAGGSAHDDLTVRKNLAAFDTAGALLSWQPSADRQVDALVLAPDKSRVIVGGRFATISTATAGSQSARGSASLDAVTGALLPWALNQTLYSYGSSGSIDSLSTDGAYIYGGGMAALPDPSNFEGRFAADPTTGAIIWANACYGDTYGTLPVGQVLYSVSHAHDCAMVGSFPAGVPTNELWHRTLAETTYANGATNTAGGRLGQWTKTTGLPTAQLLDWFPVLGVGSTITANVPAGTVATSGTAQAGWSLTSNAAGTIVAVGGEFPTANGVGQQGLARFTTHALAPNKVGPQTPVGGLPAPSLGGGPYSGSVNVSWDATYDRDNQLLTYQVVRDGELVHSTSVPSTFWQTPRMNFVDIGLSTGVHNYVLRAIDPDHNVATSQQASIFTFAATPTPPSTNLALYKATSESSLNWIFEPRGGVDGSTWTPAITLSKPHSWWQVDLGSTQPVGSMKVFARIDCCFEQSAAYWIFVSNVQLDPSVPPEQLAAMPGVTSLHQSQYPGPVNEWTLPTAMNARYVLIAHDNTDYLSLADVAVFAPPAGVVVPVQADGGGAHADGGGAHIGDDAPDNGPGNAPDNAPGSDPGSDPGNGGGNGGAGPPAKVGAGSELAKGRPATQSSTPDAAAASRAVDGNTAGAAAQSSISGTELASSPWWQVDLGKTYVTTSINIYEPTDAGIEVPAGYWVILSNHRIDTNQTPAQLKGQHDVYEKYVAVAPHGNASVELAKGASARWVTIMVDPSPAGASQRVQLAEVQVYGTAAG